MADATRKFVVLLKDTKPFAISGEKIDAKANHQIVQVFGQGGGTVAIFPMESLKGIYDKGVYDEASARDAK